MNQAQVGLDFEDSVRQRLKRIGFKKVAGGNSFVIGGHQIDACGVFEDVLVVAECTQSSSDTASLRQLILEVKGKQGPVRRGFREHKEYKDFKHCAFLIVTRNIRHRENDLSLAHESPRVHLIDDQTIEYYRRLAPVVKTNAIYNLLGELDISPTHESVPQIPALKVLRPKDLPMYLFWCDAQDLFKIAYVARRESGREKFYQRFISSSRLNSIKKYLDDGNVFPNNIIIGFEKKPEFKQHESSGDFPNWVQLGKLTFPSSYRSAWIIDGQHRLFGFSRVAPNPQRQKLPVLAFESLPIERQAKFFIDINANQKEVGQDLILDLEAELRPFETLRGRIALTIREINSLSPLRDRIYFPISGQRKRGQLKPSGIYTDLEEDMLLGPRTRSMTQTQKNPLLQGLSEKQHPKRVAQVLARFLEAVKPELTAENWNGVLLRPGGLTLAIHVFESVIARLEHVPSEEETQKYATTFALVINDMVPNASTLTSFIKRNLTSYAQRRQTLSEVLTLMQDILGDNEFAKSRLSANKPLDKLIRFERSLARFVTQQLGITTMVDLRAKAQEAVWKVVESRLEAALKTDPTATIHEQLTLGQTKQIIERKDNREVLLPLFQKPNIGFLTDQEVFGALEALTKVSNSKRHGTRSPYSARVDEYIATFERQINVA